VLQCCSKENRKARERTAITQSAELKKHGAKRRAHSAKKKLNSAAVLQQKQKKRSQKRKKGCGKD